MDPFEQVLKILEDEKKRVGQQFGVAKTQERFITQVRFGAQHHILRRVIGKIEKLQQYHQEEENGSK